MTEIHYSPNLLLVMDCLWFQQAILFSEPHIPKPSVTLQPNSQTSQESLSSLEEEFSDPSDTTSPQEDSLKEESEDEETDYDYNRKRPTRLILYQSGKTRSQPSSPLMHKLPKHLRHIRAATPLRKTMSCKSLFELEYEEVKGFMDLGFKFNKEELCPRMMSVLPGLQRLDEYNKHFDADEVEQIDAGEMRAVRRRPYLSEAWLINRPDSPLLNMRIPRIPTSKDDMKRHLKCWARTVASVIQLEY